MLSNLAGVHARGSAIDWQTVNQSEGRLVRLPAYPWSREGCWIESEDSKQKRLADTIHPLLGLTVDAVEPTWEFALDPRLFPYLQDHQIWDGIVFPAAGFGEIGLALADQVFPEQPHVVESIDIEKALFVFEDKPATVRVVFDPVEKSFEILSASGDRAEWERHASGRLTPSITHDTAPCDLDRLQQSLSDYIDHERYYAGLLDAGYGFGPTFREIQNVWAGNGEALAEIEVPAEIRDEMADYHFHPAVLDACFQAFRATQTFEDESHQDLMFLPAAIRRLRTYTREMPIKIWAHAIQRQGDHESMICDIRAYDEQGQPVADILGFRVDVAERKSETEHIDACLYQFDWQLNRLRGTGAEGSCEFGPTQEMVRVARQAMPELCEEYQLVPYAREYTPRSAKVIAQFIQNGFIDLGWDPKVGDVVDFEPFGRKLGIVRQCHRLARVQLTALEEQGFLKQVGADRWEVIQQPVRRCTDCCGGLG
ncbi:MAG: polyketide synthase dehydratase domain-containing protein, partial [Planctomycetota bacterium]